MVKVLGLGDNVCDIYLNERTMYPGGQAVNFAVYAGMLGVKSDFMGVFGNDAIAGHVKASLDAIALDTAIVAAMPEKMVLRE